MRLRNSTFKINLFIVACLVHGLSATQSMGYTFIRHNDATSYVKWDPGRNTSSEFDAQDTGSVRLVNHSGPGKPGGATWSIMGVGKSDSTGWDGDHSTSTVDIIDLGVQNKVDNSWVDWVFDDYKSLFDSALNVWASVSAFTNLGYVTDSGVNAGDSESVGGHLGDIRIAAWDITTPNVLAHAYQPGTEAIFGDGGTIAGDAHFDYRWSWVDDPTDTIGDGEFDLFTVALHEFGHSLGLGHSNVPGSVMEPVYAGARRELQNDDLAGITALYGPVPEPSTILLVGVGAVWLIRLKRRRLR